MFTEWARRAGENRQDRPWSVDTTVLLIAHGSVDPRADAVTRSLARRVGALVSYLDHAHPRPGPVLIDLAARGCRRVVVVPLLLTAAYHRTHDIPAVVAGAAGLDLTIALADVLGPVGGDAVPQGLLAALRRRIAETDTAFDAVVLAAAGTRDPAALATMEQMSRSLGVALKGPSLAGFVSAGAPTPGAAVALLRARGARRVVVASYFLAPGRLYDEAVASSLAEGAVAVTEPLADTPELARLVRVRAAAATVVS